MWIVQDNDRLSQTYDNRSRNTSQNPFQLSTQQNDTIDNLVQKLENHIASELDRWVIERELSMDVFGSSLVWRNNASHWIVPIIMTNDRHPIKSNLPRRCPEWNSNQCHPILAMRSIKTPWFDICRVVLAIYARITCVYAIINRPNRSYRLRQTWVHVSLSLFLAHPNSSSGFL